MKRIREALAPCAKCDGSHRHGCVSLDAASVEWATTHGHCDAHGQTDGVTSLPPEVEDAVRKVTATLFQLDPLELLLLQHRMKADNSSGFRQTLRDLRDRLATRYDLSDGSRSFKATVHAWKRRILARLPVFSSIFGRG